MEVGLQPLDFRRWCRSLRHYWVSEQTCIMATVVHAWYLWQDTVRLFRALCDNSVSCVRLAYWRNPQLKGSKSSRQSLKAACWCWPQIPVPLAWTDCWKRLSDQARLRCRSVRTCLLIWILLTTSVYLLRYVWSEGLGGSSLAKDKTTSKQRARRLTFSRSWPPCARTAGNCV